MSNTDKNTPIPKSVLTEEVLRQLKFVLDLNNTSQAERIIEQFIFNQKELSMEFAKWLRDDKYNTEFWYKEKTIVELYSIFEQERSEN